MDVRKKKNMGWPAAPGFSGRMHQDNATINRIMLRFRPIAPKPATDGSVSDSSKTSTVATGFLAKRRPKRKYVRVNKNNNNTSGSRRRRKCKTVGKAIEEDRRKDLRLDDDGGGGVFRLQTTAGETVSQEDMGSATEMMMSFGLPITMRDDNLGPGLGSSSGLGEGSDRRVESWVVVNGMTETTLVEGVGGGGLGSTDREKIRNLETDTCPGLISDGLHRVQWVNLAYKRMVDPRWEEDEVGGPPAEVVVWLVLNENIPVGWAVFACTVRVVYTWRKEKYTKTMPCDVWKMDFGGFAWRLDAKAALCLGR